MRTARILATIAAIAFSALLVGASSPPCALAQGSACSDNCKAAYGACYKSTANRAACEAQLERCLQGCLSQRR